jgi:hypothetical protein
MKRAASFACCWIFMAPLLAWQVEHQVIEIRRVYVETFAVKGGSDKLRRDVIAQLRKLNLISLVSTKSAADAVLSGDGEIWVKGYRSLNPRSGRSPSNGTPVYGGFLSVELKDARGETVWSYLVTPGAGSEDVSKDLSKRIVRHLSEALAPDNGSGSPPAAHR